jgi:hypothetical protein
MIVAVAAAAAAAVDKEALIFPVMVVVAEVDGEVGVVVEYYHSRLLHNYYSHQRPLPLLLLLPLLDTHLGLCCSY